MRQGIAEEAKRSEEQKLAEKMQLAPARYDSQKDEVSVSVPVTRSDILHAVDETVKTVQCKKESKKGCNGKATKCVTHNLWDELETHINTFFEKKSLQDLLKNNSERVN